MKSSIPKPQIRDLPGATQLSGVRGAISLRLVNFSYDDGDRVLHDVELDVREGEVVALVGPSGAGKSTLFNLISAILRSGFRRNLH